MELKKGNEKQRKSDEEMSSEKLEFNPKITQNSSNKHLTLGSYVFSFTLRRSYCRTLLFSTMFEAEKKIEKTQCKQFSFALKINGKFSFQFFRVFLFNFSLDY